MYLHLHTLYRNLNGHKPSHSVSIISSICHLYGQVTIELVYGFLKYCIIYDHSQLLIKFPLHKLGYSPERNKYGLES
ncbi:hypothetical protein SAMN05428978_102131 [Nitrosomonas sp. Nm34]|nr:hypothetical protein SAMN05428978_102131 [Nitrosomonas sp. Nm34]